MQKQKNKNSNKINNRNYLNYTDNTCSWSHTINRIISLYYRKFTDESFLYSFLKPLILTIIMSLGYLLIYNTTFIHIIFITLFLGFSSYYRYKNEVTRFKLFNYGLIASFIFSYNMLLIGNYSILIHIFDTILFTGILTRVFLIIGEIY